MMKAYVQTRSGLIHYVTAGDGPALILLHETPRSLRMYAQMIPHLPGFRVVALDSPGFGESHKVPGDYSITDYAMNVVSVMDALNLPHAHIFGDHTGAAIAVETAIAAPERVGRLILSGLPFWLNEQERIERHRQVVARDLIAKSDDGSHVMRIWAFLKGRIPGGERGLNPADMELLSEITLDALRAGPAWKQVEILMSIYDPMPRLPLVKAPTLAIGVTGEGTSIYTKRPRDVAALVPRGIAHVMEGIDGRVISTHAGDIAAVVKNFLNADL